MMKRTMTLAALIALSLGTTAQAADQSLLAARQKLVEDHGCISCHIDKMDLTGADGQVLHAPDIAGKMSFFIRKDLKAFREGSRQSDFMNAVAANLTDAEIQELAAYFSALGSATGPDAIWNHMK